ncbi:MAG TPA: hypothetical protein VFT22_12875, partial [Kofleriaceae bacterium]|nr:hypothetical protein [Kofleriaceae bacterium]
MRSFLRWLCRLALGALAVAVIAAAIALLAAHTGWGREQLRRRAEATLREAFPGGARVGSIEGSVLGTLTVRDVELLGRDHRPVIAIGTAQVSLALWPLAVRTAQIDRLVADEVRVSVRPEAPPAEAPPPGPPSPWRVELLHAELHRASLEIEAGGATQALVG